MYVYNEFDSWIAVTHSVDMRFAEDFRFALRAVGKDPRFSVPTICALALTIGANLSVFTVAHSVLIEPLPLRHPEELVAVWSMRPDGIEYPFNLANFLDVRDCNDVMDDMAAYAGWNANLTGDANPERLLGARVTANYFQLLGVDSALGRTLTPEDDRAGSPKVVVLTWRLWQRRYAGSRDVLGKTIRLNGDAHVIVGVLPSRQTLRNGTADFAVPLSPDTDPYREKRNTTNFLRVFGRLKPGMTPDRARANLDAVAAKLRREFPEANAWIAGIAAVPLRDDITGPSRPMLLTLLGAVGFVLLIACANISSLWIAKAAGRRKEMAIRVALGGTRWKLARQVLLEGVLLAAAGAGLGILFAVWGVPLLLSLSPSELPRAGEVHIGPVVLLAAAVAALICGAILAVFPALQFTASGVSGALRDGCRGSAGSAARSRVRSALVVVEVTLSLLLLIAAGLAMRSFHRMTALDPGFRAENLLTLRLALPATRYRNPASMARFRDELHMRVAAIPGVAAVGSISILPLSGPLGSADFTIDGQPPVSLKEKPTAQYRMIDPTYFGAMQIPIVRGRNFTERDNASGSSVVIVSEMLAKVYWKGRDPVGSHLKVEDNSGRARDVEVVGVSGNVRELALDQPPTVCLFVPIPQIPVDLTRFLTNNFFWAIRRQPGLNVASQVRREILAVDADVAASESSMESYVDLAMGTRRFSLRLLTTFALAALLLAGGGLYALVSYGTAHRRREIAIRMALGARPGEVVGLVLRQGVSLAAAGVLVGTACGWAGSKYVGSLLFEIGAHDAAAIGGSGAVMVAVAAAASWFPARRAAGVDPAEALRGE